MASHVHVISRHLMSCSCHIMSYHGMSVRDGTHPLILLHPLIPSICLCPFATLRSRSRGGGSNIKQSSSGQGEGGAEGRTIQKKEVSIAAEGNQCRGRAACVCKCGKGSDRGEEEGGGGWRAAQRYTVHTGGGSLRVSCVCRHCATNRSKFKAPNGPNTTR